MKDALRLPLQLGTTSLWSLARAAAAGLPGLILLLGGTVGFFLGLANNVDVELLAGTMGALGLAGGLFSYFAYTHWRFAVASRPSDVLLSPQGLQIDGGVNHGCIVKWQDLDPAQCTIQNSSEKRFSALDILLNTLIFAGTVLSREKIADVRQSNVLISRLTIFFRGQRWTLAQSERPIERESLEALLDSLQSPAWYGKELPPAPKGDHQVLLCEQCGGRVTPDDQERVTCPFCSSKVLIPQAWRERIRASRQTTARRRSSEKLVRKLIDQPGASSTSKKLLSAAIPMLLAWPLALGLAVWRLQHDALSVEHALRLLMFPGAMILGFFFLMRGQLVDRFALRMLTLELGARSPAKAGEPYSCRQCGAALAEPPSADHIVLRCAFCDADNVLGVDLRGTAQTLGKQTTSLAAALRKRTSERWLWRGLTLAAVVLIAIGAQFLWAELQRLN